MLADLLTQTLTVTRKAWANDAGRRTPADTTTTLLGLAQPRGADRVQLWGLDVGEQPYVVYFDQDPGVKVDDTITLPDGAVLLCLGPAADQGGQGTVWAVQAKRRQ